MAPSIGISSGDISTGSAHGTGGGSAPALLPLGAKLAFAGDSIINYNHLSATGVNQIRNASRGEVTHALMRSSRWSGSTGHDQSDANGRFFTGMNHGVSGDTTTGLLARLSAVIAMAPAACIVAIGTNNLSPTATAISEVGQICDALIAANIKVVLCTVRPWSTAKSGNNQTSRDNRVTVNTGIRAYAASKPVVKLCDFDLVYDPTTTGYGPVSWFTDGLHPNDLGASKAGAFLQSVLDTIVTSGNILTRDFWATGNLQTNPNFTGTSGVASTGTTGTVPTGWRTTRPSGSSTAVISVAANAVTSGQSVVLDITTAGVGAQERIELTYGTTGLVSAPSVENNWIRSWVEMEYDGASWWGSPQLQLFHGTDGTQFSAAGYNILTPVDCDLGTGRLFLATEPLPCPAGMVSYKNVLQMRFNPSTAAGAVGRVKVHRMWTGLVANPGATWN